MSKLLKQIKQKNSKHYKEIFDYFLMLDDLINLDEISIAREYITSCQIDNSFYALHFFCNNKKDFNIKAIKEISEDVFYELQMMDSPSVENLCNMLGFEIYEDNLLTINPN